MREGLDCGRARNTTATVTHTHAHTRFLHFVFDDLFHVADLLFGHAHGLGLLQVVCKVDGVERDLGVLENAQWW